VFDKMSTNLNLPKQDLASLSLFSNTPPLFENPLHVGRPNIGKRDALLARLSDVLDRRWLTNDGPLVRELESRCAEFIGVKHCVAVANATLGLQIAARVLEVKGKVLVPAFTFIGTVHALSWIGLEPVFCDVLAGEHTLDPEDVLRKIEPGLAAILGVHLWGRPCRVETLQKIADTHSLPLIFDAAHALGSSLNGKRVGHFGRVEVFSLHATKIINGLEGGLVTTNDDLIAEKIRLARNYGFVGVDQVASLGINAKMNEFCAAMALTNLEAYPEFQAHNTKIHDIYTEGLSDLEGILVVPQPEEGLTNLHYFVLDIAEQSPVSRDNLYAALWAENVYARRYFRPGCHRSPPYSEIGAVPDLPVTDALSARLLQLPTGQQMTEQSARDVVQLVRLCHSRGQELGARLAG